MMIHQMYCGPATPEGLNLLISELFAGPFTPVAGPSGDDHFLRDS